MPKYKAHPGVEVIGSSILAAVEALDTFKESSHRVLAECGLVDVKPDRWYPQQKLLDFFEAVEDHIRQATRFMTGQNIASAAKSPPEPDTLEKMLSSVSHVVFVYRV
jgi:hypothetical protein